MKELRMARSLLIASLALAACNGTGPRDARPLSLSVTTRSSTAAPTPSPTAITIGTGANSLTLTKVQVVLARIELATSGGCAPDTPVATAQPADMDEEDCDELQAGPA